MFYDKVFCWMTYRWWELRRWRWRVSKIGDGSVAITAGPVVVCVCAPLRKTRSER